MPNTNLSRQLSIDRMVAVAQRRRVEVLAAHARIEAVYRARCAMRPIACKLPGHPQAPAEPYQIFELRRLGEDRYYLFREVDSPYGVPVLSGAFDFVILCEAPGTIYVGANATSVCGRENPVWAIDGHTSISRGAPVLFAGSVYFIEGRMKRWSGWSGHYMPSSDDRANLIPAVRLLLPDSKFHDPSRDFRILFGHRH